jgi:pimeloyl-ACP methyl ester carboxylesterase
MATEQVGGVRLRYELEGRGEAPLVLVHGSWGSHQQWDRVVPGLGESFRVLRYDRRGHGGSECPAGQGSLREDVGDLAALIESLGLAPAWVAGNSMGASIALRLAAERPELLRGVVGHEPPLFLLLADDPAAAPLLGEVRERLGGVVARIGSGDAAGAAEEFMEMALAPGEWAQLPPDFRQTAIDHAHTFLDEAQDPEALAFDVAWLRDFTSPLLLTGGQQSPPTYAPVIALLAAALPRAQTLTFPDAGHLPHVTHPAAYVDAVRAFVLGHEA